MLSFCHVEAFGKLLNGDDFDENQITAFKTVRFESDGFPMIRRHFGNFLAIDLSEAKEVDLGKLLTKILTKSERIEFVYLSAEILKSLPPTFDFASTGVHVYADKGDLDFENVPMLGFKHFSAYGRVLKYYSRDIINFDASSTKLTREDLCSSFFYQKDSKAYKFYRDVNSISIDLTQNSEYWQFCPPPAKCFENVSSVLVWIDNYLEDDDRNVFEKYLKKSFPNAKIVFKSIEGDGDDDE